MKKLKKTGTVASEIIEGLREFAETLEGKESLPKKFNCRLVELDLRPTTYDPEQIKRIRELLQASQKVFAQFLGVSVKAVSSWEQGVNRPSDMACRFMDEIRANPSYWMKRLRDVAVLK